MQHNLWFCYFEVQVPTQQDQRFVQHCDIVTWHVYRFPYLERLNHGQDTRMKQRLNNGGWWGVQYRSQRTLARNVLPEISLWVARGSAPKLLVIPHIMFTSRLYFVCGAAAFG
jgi:hypothetical protein